MIIKNSNLRRNIFENRYKILAIIVAIILVLCLIRVLNDYAKELNKKQNVNTINPNSSYKPQETTILGSNVKEEVQQKNTKVMDEFIKYCNSKEIEKAYNLLTEECKIEKFSNSIENFKKDYVEKIFTTTKTYNMQSWINGENPTYKVRILNDVLSTGSTGEVVEDYVTIVKENNSYKINLNSYIGSKTNINKPTKQGDITLTLLSKETNMNYEIYNIKVENNTENTILLDTKTKQKSVYATGSNKATYTAFIHEIENTFLTIKPHIYRTISIKINKIYSPNIGVNKITFTDVIMNLEAYNNTQNKKDYPRTTIEMNV